MVIEMEARAALAAKGEAEQRLAAIALCPPWRHAAFAAVMAALVGSPAAPLGGRFVVVAAALVTIALIVRSDRRRLGVFINGYRRGRTRLVTFPLLLLVLLLDAASVYCTEVLGAPALSLGLALLTFAISFAGSVIWQKVFVRELGA